MGKTTGHRFCLSVTGGLGIKLSGESTERSQTEDSSEMSGLRILVYSYTSCGGQVCTGSSWKQVKRMSSIPPLNYISNDHFSVNCVY